eukprot:6347265-Alexandrium_andersonii.AAC.1
MFSGGGPGSAPGDGGVGGAPDLSLRMASRKNEETANSVSSTRQLGQSPLGGHSQNMCDSASLPSASGGFMSG